MLRFFGLLPVDEQKKLAVWNNGHIIQGYDPAVWRHDDFGRTIRYGDYGDRGSLHGWELFPIHSTPLFGGETIAISNLRPLHCRSRARTPRG
jgi:hypothetical protein